MVTTAQMPCVLTDAGEIDRSACFSLSYISELRADPVLAHPGGAGCSRVGQNTSNICTLA